jgi:hypothetical protein
VGLERLQRERGKGEKSDKQRGRGGEGGAQRPTRAQKNDIAICKAWSFDDQNIRQAFGNSDESGGSQAPLVSSTYYQFCTSKTLLLHLVKLGKFSGIKNQRTDSRFIQDSRFAFDSKKFFKGHKWGGGSQTTGCR